MNDCEHSSCCLVQLEEWQAVNEDKLRADLQKVLQQGIRSLAVVLMHAYT